MLDKIISCMQIILFVFAILAICIYLKLLISHTGETVLATIIVLGAFFTTWRIHCYVEGK